jgi:hypothetical protein
MALTLHSIEGFFELTVIIFIPKFSMTSFAINQHRTYLLRCLYSVAE